MHHYLLILPLILLPYIATSNFHHHHYKGLKSLHFTLFQQIKLNKTDYIIVNGVAGAGFGQTTFPFGTLIVSQDPMTLTPNSTSKVVGTWEAITIFTSMNGLDGLAIFTVFLNLKHYKGSVSVVGVASNIKASYVPVVGGTGDFLFVQGYVRTSPVVLTNPVFVYKNEFHLYWPPYAVDHKS